MPDRPRSVLDTNLLVRGLLTPHGFTGKLLRAAADERFVLVTSELILAEFAATLSYPRIQRYGPFGPKEVDEAILTLRAASEVVPGIYAVDVVRADPKDNPILACALEGNAAYVVTDDRRHLLPMKVYQRVQIVSAVDFLRQHIRRG